MSGPVRWEEITPTPWRNGGGVTREITAEPAGAAEFDWRVSIAQVDRSGPFSTFPGVDRVITLLEGHSMVLASPAGEKRLEPLQPYAFRGEEEVGCTLPDGPTRDFNVMTARDRCTASVRVHQEGRVTLDAADRLIVALGSVRAGDWQLGRYDALRVTGPLNVDGAFLEVTFAPVG